MLWKYTVKPYDRNICYRKNSGNQEHHLSFFRLNITNKSQTSLASWFMYTALQQTFQLLESSKVSSLLTKQCCYHKLSARSLWTKSKSEPGFSGPLSHTVLVGFLWQCYIFSFQLVFLICTSFPLNLDFTFHHVFKKATLF